MTPQQYDHLSDRELLLLTAQTVDAISADQKEMKGDISALKNWRTFLTGAWAVVCFGAWCFWDNLQGGRK